MELISTIVHIYCFCLFLRILFHDPSEMFFNPLFAWVKKVTDPVVNFLKNNNIARFSINPWIPIMGLLFLKSLLYRSTLESPFSVSLQTSFMASVLEYFSFLFKTCLFIYWMVFSSYKYNVYDEIFNVFAVICNKIISLVPLHKRHLSVRNEPLNSFSMLLILFFSCFMVINVGILFLEPARDGLTLKNMSLLPFKIILSGLIEMISYLPFLIFIRILISWFMPPVTRIFVMLHAATEPILEPFRRLGLVVGMFDFSPIVAFFVLSVLINVLQKIFATL